ncbi:peptide chain release factor 2 [Vibrio sp. JCM 19052]|nr:peptide chain release factor 2 [Vibrio sp. JCM 19052]
MEQKLEQLEFRRMFSGDHDSSDCYIDLQAGSGGTEAQDWTNMMLRMYLRWLKQKASRQRLSKYLKVKLPALKARQLRFLVSTLTVGYVQKQVFTV